jgi:hypothetical protein
MTLFTKSAVLSLILLLSSGGSNAFTPAARFGVTPTKSAFRTTTRSLSTPLRVVSSPDQEQQAPANNEIEKLRSMAAKLRAEAASLEAEKAARKNFKKFDTNQDGEITLEELKAGLEKTFKMDVSEARVQELMETFDISRDGALQLDEYVAVDQFALATTTMAAAASVTTTTTGSWRITLDIGREPLTSMPFDWAASGCRLPLAIKCDFSHNNENGSNEVVPQQENCRFTGPEGEVVKPIQKGVWSLNNENRNLEFSLNFPQDLVRRDVVLDAGTEIFCEGLVYSTKALKKMNDKFYKARDDTWKAGEVLNNVNRRKEASKKWNEDKQEWEKRYEEEPLLSKLGKQINLMNVKRQSDQNNANRPKPKTLSLDSGPFPGFDSDVFIQKTGIVKIKRGWRESVIGTWSAEPITGKPVSYYN